MGFRSYYVKLIFWIILLVINAVLLGWAMFASRIHVSILLGISLTVVLVILFKQVTRINREVLFFFRALENDDSSISYGSAHQSSFINELHQHLNRLNRSFQEMKLSNERREQYFSQILEQLSSGLIVITKTGHISHINEEALRLLNLSKLTHIRALSQKYPGLSRRMKEMNTLDRSEISLQDRETGLKRVLGIQAVEINLKGEDVRVVSIHDLSAGMERKEIDDWIRLIRILSHEIMNSLAPITSISTTLKEVWAEYDSTKTARGAAASAIQQTTKGLDAIAEQSAGLTTFFESYRILSRIPDPLKKELIICDLFDKLETLVEHYKEKSDLRISIECPSPELKIQADEQMLTQVLLNLVKNAVQAVAEIAAAEISISASKENNRIFLKVTDNGEGIPPEISDEIFMPFFTTRKKGTGVGLSYSRQVMALNGGRIEFDSQPGNTQFRLIF